MKAPDQIRAALSEAARRLGAPGAEIVLERPKDPGHGDLATNLALALAKTLKAKPRDAAQRLLESLDLPAGVVRKTEIAGPGFINFFLAEQALASVIALVIEAGTRFGRSDGGAGAPVNVEFVSANPTGPLHVGHGRQAALGDGIAELLAWTGWKVSREFYYNDAGGQIERLTASVLAPPFFFSSAATSSRRCVIQYTPPSTKLQSGMKSGIFDITRPVYSGIGVSPTLSDLG